MNKITIVGSGYVGMSLAVLLSQNNPVVILDIDDDRVKRINNNQSTVADKDIEAFLINKKLNLTATLDKEFAYKDANFIVIATPTNYDPETASFDTSSVDNVVKEALNYNKKALIVIKSTIPIGHIKLLQEKFLTDKIVFSPEFLREGRALQDNLFPSRIIMGSESEAAKLFVNLLITGAEKKHIQVLFTDPNEAEAIKLFANTYLAMRIAFFNELDSFALCNDLDAKSIINGIALDNRIGEGYNNPSFGYGGYCLPKDTKQLLANFNQVPQKLIQAIVSSNATRKNFIANEIIKLKPKTIGFYRLIMKQGSDNFRSSAIKDIMKFINAHNIETIIYEPRLKSGNFSGSRVSKDINKFKEASDLVVTNRMSNELIDIEHKCFTRDLFGNN